MNISEFQTLTGISVSSADESRYTAMIRRTQRMLESILGFTLDPDLYDNNQYTESGKTTSECPCPSDTLTLDDPDAVVFAYRLYPYNRLDKFLALDPASAIHKVKLVKENVTYKTLESDEFRAHYKNGIIKYLEQIQCWCWDNCDCCDQLQLAIDATWLWSNGNIPQDLLDIWTDMIVFYSDQKNNIKQETLGPHSYTKFDNKPPEQLSFNQAILKKYSGPNGVFKTKIVI